MANNTMAENFPTIEFHNLDKDVVFEAASEMLKSHGFDILESDKKRPWGFFLSVDEKQAQKFIDTFYQGVELNGINTSLPLRPKILGIQPHRRLSLQKHLRRSEIWRGIGGHFHVLVGPDENSLEQYLIEPGETIVLPQGIVHRGAGLADWGLVAEIWQHTDPAQPSNEDDIVRLEDDFGRD